MHAPQRMHLSEVQNSFKPRRAERPLSTSTTCISPPSRGPRKCDVYCVIGIPVALRVRSRIKTSGIAYFLSLVISSSECMEAALAWFMPRPFNVALPREEKPKTFVFLRAQHLGKS